MAVDGTEDGTDYLVYSMFHHRHNHSDLIIYVEAAFDGTEDGTAYLKFTQCIITNTINQI